MAFTLSAIGFASGSLFAQDAYLVVPEFENSLELSDQNSTSSQASSVAFFSGSFGAYAPAGSADPAVIPTAADTGYQLEASSFGQSLSAGVPFPDFVDEIVDEARELLYPPSDATREQVEGSDAAFRYKELLYNSDGEGAVSLDPQVVNDAYGAAERARARDALALVSQALKHAPTDVPLRHSVLDIYYDLALAEMQSVKQDYASVAEVRLGFRAVPDDGFIIDEEISVYRSVLDKLSVSLDSYGELFSNHFGNVVADIDASAPAGIPFGAYLFVEEQPYRNQYAASYADSSGRQVVPEYDPETEEVVASQDERILFSGYKDYVMVATLLGDYANASSELARLYGMRGLQGDRQTALNLIAETQREVSVSLRSLRTLFGDFEPSPGDASGLSAALKGARTSLAELTQTESFLVGSANSLGFDPNFLVLIQEFPDQNSGNQFDSYDALNNWIRHTNVSPLTFAETTYDRAKDSYDTYRGNADQVHEQLSQLESAHSDRYFEITGYNPSDAGDHAVDPAPGSELWQTNQKIDRARQKNEEYRDVSREISRSFGTAYRAKSEVERIQGDLEEAHQTYLDTITLQRDIISHWSATSALWQATYDTISDTAAMSTVDKLALGPWSAGITFGTGVANAAVQYASGRIIGNAEKELDLAAAEFEARQEENDTQIALNQVELELASLNRERVSLVLDRNDNLAIQNQEIGQRDQLLRELERIEQKLDENVASLHNRYYADPIHYLRSQSDMVTADNAFREAQKWVFYTVRALEFKWNKDFEISYLEKDWETSTLFKLRNFRELEQMVAAMEQFNTINLVGFNREPFVDRISLLELLASNPKDGADDGERYDMETGEIVSPVELMRRKLERAKDGEGNIVITLDTFSMDRDSGFFFLGPDYRSDGSVLSAGKYLDKIEWIKLNAVTSEQSSVKSAILEYGGTCYVRNRVPPCYDSSDPFSLDGEFRRFPFRYFFTLDNGASWVTRPSQEDTVKLVISNQSGEPEQGVPNSTLENTFLKERSVATTDLTLTIPDGTLDLSQLDDIEIYIRHLFVSRVVPDCD
ncbi:hypothetical protein [Pelagicoccus sp. SDUM812003]|uniref:hypothetical protein n=1 Tax=Pelagicoccus sp. SDUM812003 TaxID=3041267 RepID=UPI00280E003F|nr:hypothetical protein [Pelagicoccus sp. SDUM812003]MDQ8202389.1 hypothetical protein [Pelagicoccus sp. SDUM812003]